MKQPSNLNCRTFFEGFILLLDGSQLNFAEQINMLSNINLTATVNLQGAILK